MPRSSTRFLLTCAAIGVGSGLPFAVTGYLHAVVLVVAPMLYGLLIGLYFLPGVIAQSVLRRGGVAMITGTIAGLTASAFDPMHLPQHIGTSLLIGALQELPFAVRRYRYWQAWVYYLAAGIAGLLFAGVAFVVVAPQGHGVALSILYLALWFAAPVIVTWIGRLIARGIDRTGVARGVQGEIDRRPPRPTPGLQMALA